MARKASPWFREERNEWCVTIRGKHHNLGKHPDGAARPKKSDRTGKWNAPPEIEKAFRTLLDKPEEPKAKPVPAGPPQDSVVVTLDRFIDWCEENREAITAARYKEFIQDFVKADAGGVKIGMLGVSDLTPQHVTDWLDARPGWGPTTRRNAITAIQRGFNWAVRNLNLVRNPIKGMQKPTAKRRSDVITPVEFDELLSLIGDGPFAELLTVSYDCGARPFEVKDLERRHVQLEHQRAVIPADEAKGRKHTRTIYFPTERSMEIVTRLCRENPDGPIFLNTRGQRWTGLSVKCRFEDIETAFGLAEMKRQNVELDTSEESIAEVMATLSPTRKSRSTGKQEPKLRWEIRKEARQKLIARQAKEYGKRFNHYAFRRTFITRKIIAGVDSHVVAKLAGHQSTAMIDRHYSCVADDAAFMLQQASRDIKPKNGQSSDK